MSFTRGIGANKLCRAARTARALWVLTALGCADGITGGDLPNFAIVPDSVTGWVGDTLVLRVTSDAASTLSAPSTLTWAVADTSVAVFTETGDDGATLVVRGSGTTVVTARTEAHTRVAQVTGLEEGELLSSYTVGGVAWLQSPAFDDDGNVYLPSMDDSVLLALDRELSLRWERGVGYGGLGPLGPAIGDDGSLYFSAYRYTAAYSSAGTLRWEDTTHTGGETAPAIGPGGLIYVGGARFPGTLDTWAIAAYDAAGAQAFRTLVFNNTIKVGLTIVADSVVVGADLAGRAFGLSLSGSVLWVDTLPSRLRFFNPSVGADGRTIYLPGQSHVVATDALTGERRWVWDAGGPNVPLTPVVDRDGVLYVQTQWSDSRPDLVALYPDGTVKWSADLLGGYQWVNAGGAPALAEGGLLYVACGNDLCAVRTADGSVRWRRALPFPGSAGPIMIAPDSSIVFVTLGATLRAVGYDSARVVRLRGRFPLADAPWPVDGGNLRHTRRARRPQSP